MKKLLFIAIMLLALVSVPVLAQCPDDYGCFLPYRNDIWPRDGLREHFILDPGVEGNALANGSFERWPGIHLECTDCPTDWSVCHCVNGDILPESTYLYDYDKSLKMVPGGGGDPYVNVLHSWDVGECYQVTFWYMGEAGTEDFYAVVGNSTVTDTYNPATDTFTAGFTSLYIANAPTVWTQGTIYVVGAAGKTAANGYGLGFIVASGNGTGLYVDHVEVQRLKRCGVLGARQNPLSVPVTSDPVWGHSKEMLPRTGTGPAYKTGMELDGTDDYLSCADGTCEMDPVDWTNRGFFSVGCRVIPDTVAGTGYIVAKWNGTGNQRSWCLARTATPALYFSLSDDGINSDFNSATMFTVDALHSFVSTFDPSGGSGACENNIYYNAYQVDTDATMTECVPFDSTADLQIGALTGGIIFDGSILECSLWEKELSAVDANKYISPYFPGTNHGDGFYVSTCSQAASHATCSTQKCRDGAPNTCQAEGTGVMAIFNEYDVFPENNSFATNTGTDTSPNWTDWQELATGAGDPNCPSSLTAYHADTVHGASVMRLKRESIYVNPANRPFGGPLDWYPTCTGYIWVATECLNTSKADTTFSMKIKALKDTLATADPLNGFYVYVSQYSGACGTKLKDMFYEYDPAKSGTWEDFIFIIENTDWEATADSYYLSIVMNRGWQSDILIDTIHITESSYRVPFVHVPAGGGAITYNARPYTLHNPLSEYSEPENGYAYASGFCGYAWLHTDWAGDDGVTHQIFTVPGTAGINNRWIINKANSNAVQFVLYDSAGALRQYALVSTGANWTAGGWKYLEWCSNNTDNVLQAHHYNVSNSTWYDWSNAAGAGTGIQDGQASTLEVGHDGGANYLDGYISETHIGPYPSGAFAWPQEGFNGGIPPVNHHPWQAYACPYTAWEQVIP